MRALARPASRRDAGLRSRVAKIVERVADGGWDALARIATEIDGHEPRLVEVAPLAARGRDALSGEQYSALEFAADNIRQFHERSLPADVTVEPCPGLVVSKRWRPIDRVGLYVPGGATPLFSTLMMLAIPARAAGVRDLVVVTPPDGDGGLSPILAVAASLSGIEAMWTVGGAQAIAALAFGAGGIAKVDKIFGPGNAFVAEAKRLVAAMPVGPSIDLPAGPSELMVIADSSCDPSIVAADLLSQAEHDASAQVILVTTVADVADAVVRETERQVDALPRRDTVRRSLDQARIITCDNDRQAADIANLYAPEHLSLAVDDPERLLPSIRNAGAIFAGHFAAETFGDYLAGSSHVLPTDGAARAFGGGVDPILPQGDQRPIGDRRRCPRFGRASGTSRSP